MATNRSFRPCRTGTTTVEAAFVLPVFIIFVFGLFVFCHLQMTSSMLKSSCRAAARYGSTEGITTAEADQFLRQRMAAFLDTSLIQIQIKDASILESDDPLPDSESDFAALPDIELSDAEPRQMFLVRATLAYDQAAILNVPWLGSLTLSGYSFMRHE